ncbi:MAG: ribbon-helix-helix domain-containing protein [Rhizobiaceae bacterium]|nr:ribbon-helix-helix domain-containing protein [Rhizobiaceae bacterium]MCV0405189.1 ribbon-helix-helix domain-containing protein [Rhizobiaceae bacterium]
MSGLVKRSVTIGGHRTSYSLEAAFQAELRRIADMRGIAVAALVARIDGDRPPGVNLSSAIRLFILEELKAAAGVTDPARSP